MSRDPATRRLVPRFRCMVRSWERGDEVVASGPRSGARRADRAPTCFGAFRAVTSRRGTCAAPSHADGREPAATTAKLEPPDAIGRCLQGRSERATPSIGQMTGICRPPGGRRARPPVGSVNARRLGSPPHNQRRVRSHPTRRTGGCSLFRPHSVTPPKGPRREAMFRSTPPGPHHRASSPPARSRSRRSRCVSARGRRRVSRSEPWRTCFPIRRDRRTASRCPSRR